MNISTTEPELDNDDLPIGRILTRREVLALFAAAGATALVGCGPAQSATGTPTTGPVATSVATAPVATTAPTTALAATSVATTAADTASGAVPACVVLPEVTEGPYYVDEALNRADIRSDPSSGAISAGIPLTLTFNISQVAARGCAPFANAIVDIWHCDATGVYSDVTDRGFTTTGQKFLRGYQTTDASGKATFTTIYPGWYRSRAVHIHFKVFTEATKGTRSEFTSQLFFDDSFSDGVFANAPYAAKGERTTLNSNDGIFKQELLVPVSGDASGYSASFDIGVSA